MIENGHSRKLRWEKLLVTLEKNGIVTKIDERPYPGGISYSVTIPTAHGQIYIHDTDWRDHWTGWAAYLDRNDGSGISDGLFFRAKKRSDVVNHVVHTLGIAS